ncbi:hypothetical protein HPT27_04850 [Permianibacter sp. IMCC34836]|uniref:ATP-binding protein n=1 Tax=Permianibacter fluminis TaxID=2738515 RepID=UPI0015570EC4|nr:ATP-binding protein [Permianibacter fluminis]NQD36345.1 hypothetical protein [Permianibacter fluminis]
MRLGQLLRWVILALLLQLSVSAQAALTEQSANELYQRWQQLPAAEQLPAAVDLVGYYSRQDTARAIALADLALQRFSEQTDPVAIAMLRNDRAYAQYFAGNSAAALTEVINNERFAEQRGFTAIAARAAMIQGYIYRDAGLSEQALVAQQRALQAYEKTDDVERRGGTLKAIAVLLIDLRQFAPAESYIGLINKLLQEHPELPYLQMSVPELRGLTESVQGRHEQALQAYQSALALASANGDKLATHIYHAAVGHELLQLNRPTEALQHAERGLALMMATGNNARDVNLLRIKANAMVQLKRYNEARSLLQELRDKASQRNDQANLVIILDDLYALEKQQGQLSQALVYLEQAGDLRQTLIDERSTQRAALLDAAFNSERKSRQIELLSAENRVQQLELQQQRQGFMLVVIVSILLLSLATFYYLRRQHKLELRREQSHIVHLRELDAVKDRVLANTSHELRTPLNGIVGLSELLLAEPLEPHAREYAAMISDSGRRLTEVVDELLESAHLRSGNAMFDCQSVDIREPLNKALLICLPQIQKKSLLLRNHVTGELPRVWVDPARIQQVFINLLNNACKFTDHGAIDIHAECLPDAVRVSIKDTGVGVPKEFHERIFESFVQVDGSMSRKYGGTGLGLTICKQLIEHQGGQIGLISTPGQGSTFWFSLPLAPRNGAVS